MPEARIDKWMWAARIFKTRTIAAEACKKGRISINGSQVKPARMVKPGQKGHYKYTNSIISLDLHIFFRVVPRSGLALYP